MQVLLKQSRIAIPPFLTVKSLDKILSPIYDLVVKHKV